jgi:hypothetical protein
MAETNYDHTYWNNKGKYPEIQEALSKLVPPLGKVKDAANNPALEKFRIASNCYYDLYNNGLCNRGEEFEEVFGFDAFEVGEKHINPRWDREDEDQKYSGYIDLTQELIDRTEREMDKIILEAAKEQGLPVLELSVELAQAELDRLSEQLASNHAKLTQVLSKPFVQLTGEDGNVFSIIGRVSRVLKEAKQPEKAKEFTDKAFGSGSYDEVLRLAMEYCEVG